MRGLDDRGSCLMEHSCFSGLVGFNKLSCNGLYEEGGSLAGAVKSYLQHLCIFSGSLRI